MGIVDGSEVCPPKFLSKEDRQNVLNPEFTCWTKKDQYLLGWLNTTLAEKVLSTVYGLNTSKLVWNSLANRFASQSKSRIYNIKHQLQSLRQGSKICSEYLKLPKDGLINLQPLASQLRMMISSIFLSVGLIPHFIHLLQLSHLSLEIPLSLLMIFSMNFSIMRCYLISNILLLLITPTLLCSPTKQVLGMVLSKTKCHNSHSDLHNNNNTNSLNSSSLDFPIVAQLRSATSIFPLNHG
jgi:hypothetical protein